MISNDSADNIDRITARPTFWVLTQVSASSFVPVEVKKISQFTPYVIQVEEVAHEKIVSGSYYMYAEDHTVFSTRYDAIVYETTRKLRV